MKKVVLIIALVTIFASQTQAQYVTQQIFAEANVDIQYVASHTDTYLQFQDTTSQNFKRRDPGAAFFLSFLIPGGGQFYNGQNGKGMIMLTAGVTGLALFLDGTKSVQRGPYSTQSNGGQATVGAVLMIGTGLWSMIDAPTVAKKLNKQNGLSMRMEPAVHYARADGLSVGPKLSIHF